MTTIPRHHPLLSGRPPEKLLLLPNGTTAAPGAAAGACSETAPAAAAVAVPFERDTAASLTRRPYNKVVLFGALLRAGVVELLRLRLRLPSALSSSTWPCGHAGSKREGELWWAT